MGIRAAAILVGLPLLSQAQVTAAYLGAGSCASSNCHGAASPSDQKVSRILGNEYRTWQLLDKHATAYKALVQPRSKRMAEILNITDATTDKRCTVCHVSGSPDKFSADGVSCEACHGAAEKWLGPHTQANSHAASVAAGMVDTKDLRVRANKCLECHLGAPGQHVDHDFIAAGHPDLAFELDTFTWAQPTHHRPVAPKQGDSNPRARAWAVGQARAFTQGMQLLESHAAKEWPEFSDLECYQCHHDLRLESWRIQRGYGSRRPGSLQLNSARSEVFRALVAEAAADQQGALEAVVSRLGSLVVARQEGGATIGQSARAASQLGATLADRFNTYDFTLQVVQGILQRLDGNIARIANGGVHSAEQATMSLDALSAALRGQEAAVPDAVTALYNYLEHPSTYQPGQFVALYRKTAASLR
jgi:hypothetical protein